MTELSWRTARGPRLSGTYHPAPGADGPVVVLLHAGFQTRRSWRSAVVELGAAGFDVVAYDLRGHGESGRSPDGHYAVPDHADDLAALIATLGRPAALVGASLGGSTALAVAGHDDPRVRDRVSALVLVDVVPRLEPGGRERVRAFAASTDTGFADLQEAAEKVASYVGGTPRPSPGLRHHLVEDDDGRLRWHWDPALVEGGFDAYDEEHIAAQSAAARRLDAPTLLLRGGDSDVTSDRGVAEFRELAPHAEVVEVPDVGHMVTAVPNHPYVAGAVAFLTRLGLAGPDREDPS